MKSQAKELQYEELQIKINVSSHLEKYFEYVVNAMKLRMKSKSNLLHKIFSINKILHLICNSVVNWI